MHNTEQASNAGIQWRGASPYTATSIATAGLVAETQLFLITAAGMAGAWAERAAAARRRLIDGGLPQRSRASRVTVAKRISERLVRWNPPDWVLDDLAALAQETSPDAFKAALLLHTCRQDYLLYNIVQGVVLPKWQAGERQVLALDVQRFFDAETPAHPEIGQWAYASRNRLASNTLSTLRDFGLLRSAARSAKEIIEPVVAARVAAHLVDLLRGEGFGDDEIPGHPDWQLWLWSRIQAVQAVQCAQTAQIEAPQRGSA